jgi:ribosomal protein S18 acetylase RimI-like enzyme
VVELQVFPDVEDFAATAAPLLEADEAGHCLLYATIAVLREFPSPSRPPGYFALATGDGGAWAGAATLQPPNPLGLSPSTTPEAAAMLAASLAGAGQVDAVRDVVGRPEVVEAFVAAWREQTGRLAHVHMRELLHRIDEAPQVPATPGNFRRAGIDDVDLVARWYADFTLEAWGEPLPYPLDQVAQRIAERIDAQGGGTMLWEDGGAAVAMAAYGGMTHSGVRIAPVYTPPAMRRRGYGTALTAALTRDLFARGRRSVFLFTDVSNATSNSIYNAIGYRKVSDHVHMRVDG